MYCHWLLKLKLFWGNGEALWCSNKSWISRYNGQHVVNVNKSNLSQVRGAYVANSIVGRERLRLVNYHCWIKEWIRVCCSALFLDIFFMCTKAGIAADQQVGSNSLLFPQCSALSLHNVCHSDCNNVEYCCHISPSIKIILITSDTKSHCNFIFNKY